MFLQKKRFFIIFLYWYSIENLFSNETISWAQFTWRSILGRHETCSVFTVIKETIFLGTTAITEFRELKITANLILSRFWGHHVTGFRVILLLHNLFFYWELKFLIIQNNTCHTITYNINVKKEKIHLSVNCHWKFYGIAIPSHKWNFLLLFSFMHTF